MALDRIACELVGIDPDGVSYFKVADEVGLGTTDQENIEVVGDKIEDCYKKMWVPYLEGHPQPLARVRRPLRGRLLQLPGPADPEHGDPEGHWHLRREQGHDRCGRLRQQAGNSQHPDKQIILHGNCTRRHLKEHPDAYFLPGCPPGEGSLYMTVVRKEAVTGQPELMPWIRQRMEDDAPAWRGYVEKEAAKFYGTDKP